MGVRMSDWVQKDRSKISKLRQNKMSTIRDFHSITIFDALEIVCILI